MSSGEPKGREGETSGGLSPSRPLLWREKPGFFYFPNNRLTAPPGGKTSQS